MKTGNGVTIQMRPLQHYFLQGTILFFVDSESLRVNTVVDVMKLCYFFMANYAIRKGYYAENYANYAIF